MTTLTNPLIRNRADPCILRHDGDYLFTASVPEYDRIELRRAPSVSTLADATPRVIWRASAHGPASALIWAPEIHHIDGAWYVYFAAAPSREIRDGLFQHRMYALRNRGSDPLSDEWEELGRVETGLDSFSLDATTFAHNDRRYYVWAQKDPAIAGNSNLYIAAMATPWQLAGPPVLLSRPEYDWEVQGFLVNEGPAVLVRNGRAFVSYSASATDARYCMGLLHADADADLLDPRNWRKSPTPVFATDAQREVCGPGHNSFTICEDGRDLLVYHARNYRDIEGDPLWNPDRHTCVQPLDWNADGMPVFGRPLREVEL
jgi:GH43 family beta-xylosidase